MTKLVKLTCFLVVTFVRFVISDTLNKEKESQLVKHSFDNQLDIHSPPPPPPPITTRNFYFFFFLLLVVVVVVVDLFVGRRKEEKKKKERKKDGKEK